jgi:cytochrome P450
MATQPPGSLGLPFVGEALAFLEDPFTFQSSRTQQHGEVWKTRILGSNVVFFSGPRALTFFLDPANFTREKGSPPHLQELLGHDAVPFIDGDVHRTRKRLLLQAFTKGALAGYVPGLQALVARATSALALDAETRLNPVLEQLAFDVANRLFAGAPPELSDAAMAAEFSRVVQGAFAPPINLPFTVYGRALKARDKLRAYIHEAVSTRDGAGTALAVLKAARGPGGEALTDRELEMELLHFFFAAHAGISGALAWLVVVLAQRPEVTAKVRAEVDALPAEPSYGDLMGMRYLAAVCREVRRAYPIAPSTFFGVALRDLELDGHAIPKGWKGVGALWPTLQHANTFRDPAAFEPERLTDDAVGKLPENAYVPQGGGPPEGHRCPGESFVDLVLPLFVASLLRGRDLTLPEQDLTPGAGGVGPLPLGGLRVRFTKRG